MTEDEVRRKVLLKQKKHFMAAARNRQTEAYKAGHQAYWQRYQQHSLAWLLVMIVVLLVAKLLGY